MIEIQHNMAFNLTRWNMRNVVVKKSYKEKRKCFTKRALGQNDMSVNHPPTRHFPGVNRRKIFNILST